MLKLPFVRMVLIVSFIFSLFLSAADYSFAADDGRGFTITPPIFELKANAGDSLSEVVSVFNSGSEDLSIAASVENLKPMGEKGQVQVIGSSEEGLPTLKDWIKIKESNFNLTKGTTKNIVFNLNIPANAEPGGHFATILFGTTSGKTDGTGAQLSQKIGTLVLLTIAGQANESAMVTKFSPKKGLYWNNQTINFDLKIADRGNVYIRPRGFLVITDIFGRKTAQIEIDGKNILPGATREIPLEFKAKRLFGPYTATLTLIYGNTNQNLNSTAGFWVIPWLSTSIAVALLILIIVLRRRLWKALKILFGRDK